MEHRSVLITGSGTGVGKTFIAYNLVYYLKSRGINVGYFKPIETGVQDVPQDGYTLCKLTGQDLKEAVLFTCKLPLAPYACSLEEGIEFPLELIKDRYTKLVEKYEFLLVEGAGGLAVPIKKDYNYAHLAKDLNIPILIVTYPTLGTIHSTYTTYFYAKAMGLKVLGIILNGLKGEDVSERTNARIIQELTGVEVLQTPHQKGKVFNSQLLDSICKLVGL